MNPFSIQEVIKQRVNKEALYAWATKQEVIPIPKYQKPKVIPLSAGIYNLVKQMLP